MVFVSSAVITNRNHRGDKGRQRSEFLSFFFSCFFVISSSLLPPHCFRLYFSSHTVNTPEHNNSWNNNGLLPLMGKATLTFRISQLSNQSPGIFYSFRGYAITPKDVRLVFLSNEKLQTMWPHPWQHQMGSGLMLTVWHLYNTLTTLITDTSAPWPFLKGTV